MMNVAGRLIRSDPSRSALTTAPIWSLVSVFDTAWTAKAGNSAWMAAIVVPIASARASRSDDDTRTRAPALAPDPSRGDRPAARRRVAGAPGATRRPVWARQVHLLAGGGVGAAEDPARLDDERDVAVDEAALEVLHLHLAVELAEQAQLRLGMQVGRETLALHPQQRGFFQRQNVGRVGPLVQQAHLAQHLALTHDVEQGLAPVARQADFDGAAGDDAK